MRRNNIFGQKMVSCITLNAQWLLRESWSSCLFASAIFKVTPWGWRYLVQPCFSTVSTVSIQKFTNRRFIVPLDSNNTGLWTSPPISWKCAIQTGKTQLFYCPQKFNPNTSIARKKKNIHPFLWNNIPHVFGHDRLKPVFLPIQKQEVDFSKFSGKCKDIWAKPLAGWHYQ